MEYLVRAESFKKYNLIVNNSISGEMTYLGWFNSHNPSFKIKNKNTYRIEKPSIWKTNFKVISLNQVVLECNFKWNGHVIIQLYENDEVKKMTLKLQSIWKSNYIVFNELGNEILKVECKYSWKNWKTNYNIHEHINFATSNKEILYLSLIHCIIVLKNMAAVSGA